MALIRRPTEHRTTAAPTTFRIAPQTVAREATVSPYAARQRREARQKELVDAVLQLDTKTDERARRELMDFVGSLYDAGGGGVPIGLFGKCYLGGSYLDHIVDFSGDIVEHFTHLQKVPDEYAAARPLARNDAYVFIEVYSDGQVIPIRADGSPVA